MGGGKTEIATGTGAFRVKSPPPGAAVLGIAPSIGAQGKTLDVVISGVNTHFAEGLSIANFGAGINVNSTHVTSDTSAVANISIADDAAIGFRNVSVSSGAEVATENDVGPFIVTAPPPPIPRVATVEPATGSRGQTLNVTVSGQNTNFVNGTSVVSFSGAGVAVNTTTVTSPTTVIANITISPDSALGFRDVLVTTEGEVAAGLLTFQVEDSQTPVDQISALIFLVRGLNISPGVKNALLAELNVAANGKGQSTCGSLKAFQKLVVAQSGKAILKSDADQLLAATQQITASLACK